MGLLVNNIRFVVVVEAGHVVVDVVAEVSVVRVWHVVVCDEHLPSLLAPVEGSNFGILHNIFLKTTLFLFFSPNWPEVIVSWSFQMGWEVPETEMNLSSVLTAQALALLVLLPPGGDADYADDADEDASDEDDDLNWYFHPTFWHTLEIIKTSRHYGFQFQIYYRVLLEFSQS